MAELVDATGVKVLLETEADHTGSNPVLTINWQVSSVDRAVKVFEYRRISRSQ